MYGDRRAATAALSPTRAGLDAIAGTGDFYAPTAATLGPTLGDVLPSDGYGSGDGPGIAGRNGGAAGPANGLSMTRLDGPTVAAIGAAVAQGMAGVTLRTEAAPAAAVAAGTEGASNAANRGASPQ
jgi:hypothetical protein